MTNTVSMTDQECLERVISRRDYLTARIAAKQSVGYEFNYDEDERNALTRAIQCMEAVLSFQAKA